MTIKFAVPCFLLLFSLVDATNQHLRGLQELTQWTGGVFTTSEPSPRSCTVNNIFPCAVSDQLVICGNGCTYNGFCEAIFAGSFDCEKAPEDTAGIAIGEPNPSTPPSCPEGSEDIACDLSFDPVRCGPNDCEYGNSCAAEATGQYNAETDCTRVFDIAEPAPGTCPVTGPAVSCFNERGPVLCGPDSCDYGNLCLAVGAGFQEDDCARDDSDVEGPTSCPVINFIQACTDEPAAVVCGPDSCEYDALCTAEAAGFMAEDCLLVDTCPQIELLLACELILDPIKCGEEECEYANSCLAEATGAYDVETECKSVFDIPEPEPGVCPVTGPAVSCINEKDTVLCGPDSCEYGNLCLAVGAGFQDEDCAPAPEPSCPVINFIQPCTDEPAAVICGPASCEYDAQCTADAAGFAAEDCSPLRPDTDCPIVGFVTCEIILDPIKCGEEECEYASPCLAEATGVYNPETDCQSVFDIPSPSPGVCPVTGPAVSCINERDTVLCGPDSCEYGNLCLAVGAGFKEENCSRPDDPVIACPLPANVACIEIFAPVDCGGCEYENDCFAEAAGFGEGECVPIVFDPEDEGDAPPPAVVSPGPSEDASGSNGDGCPDTSSDVICITLFDPVICGSNQCVYGNLCLAVGASFAETDCAPARR